jgi:nucleoside phosphorylase
MPISDNQVDVAVITIKQEEFEAVLDRLPGHKSKPIGRRRYAVASVTADDGSRTYTVAAGRPNAQGNAEAQALAADMLSDLDPKFLLVVGIAGGVPTTEFTLGDVIVSTHVYDFRIASVDNSKLTANGLPIITYAQHGGAVPTLAASIAANLPAMRSELGDWNSEPSIGCPKPRVILTDDTKFYGPANWQDDVRNSLTAAFGPDAVPRPPFVRDGAIASTDMLIKDTERISIWQQSARDLQAVEMELAGVYVAVRSDGDRVPFLGIRGLSDIVGFKRDSGWTLYACHTAASFAAALIRAGVLPFHTDDNSDVDGSGQRGPGSVNNSGQGAVAVGGEIRGSVVIAGNNNSVTNAEWPSGLA